MSRLPQPGGDDNQWGAILNDFLRVEHNTDGTLKLRTDGTLSSFYVKPAGGIPKADLASSVQTSLGKADTAPTQLAQLSDVNITSPSDTQVLSYDQSSGKWHASSGGSYVKLQATSPGAADTGNLNVSGIALSDSVVTNHFSQRPNKLIIYYGVPQGANAQWDDNKAAQLFAHWDYVVFGSGLEDSGNTYHSSTQNIITKMHAINPLVKVFGYVDLSVTISNLSIPAMQTKVDQWQAMGADGVLLDQAGYDYHVPRSRLNTMVDYLHGKTMGALVNAWSADDVMGSAVDATYNPSGTATHMNASDYYLLESWLINTDAYADNGFTSFFNARPRADTAIGYRNSLGVKLFAVGIVNYSSHSDEDNTKYFKMQETAAMAFSLDAYGLGAPSYSSSGADADVVRMFEYDPAYNALYETVPQYNITNDWFEVSRPDIGLTVHVDTGTTTYWYTTLATNKFNIITIDTNQDNVGIGASTPQARLHVHGHVAGTTTEIVQGASAQTADLLQLQANDSSVVAKVDIAGSPTFAGPTVALSNNVRGIAAAITNGATTLAVTFGTAQADANYAVLCTPNYGTTCYVTSQTASGFTINFGTAAPASATVHWLVVR